MSDLARILAIARLAVRSAVRSRLVISLVVLLVLAVAGLPATIKGDGTVSGEIRILIYYTLGLAGMILGAVTLWAGCAAVSQEVQQRNVQLLAVKPVRAAHIWIGKWLGLLAMNAILLTGVGVATYVLLSVRLRAAGPSAAREQALEVYRSVRAVEEPVDPELRHRWEQWAARGLVTGDGPGEQERRELQNQIRSRRLVVGPDATRSWVFEIPAGVRAGRPVRLHFQTVPSGRDRSRLTGVWSVTSSGGKRAGVDEHRAAVPFAVPVDRLQEGVHSIALPESVVVPGGSVTVRFTNGSRDTSRTVVFSSERGVELRIRESCFEMNLVRALAVVFLQLALLAAIGVSAGALFSFPVASFAAFSLVLAVLLTQALGFALRGSSSSGPGPYPEEFARGRSAVFRVGERVGQTAYSVFEPAFSFRPLGNLSEGLLVSSADTGRAALALLGGYCVVLGALGSWVLSRRELALPGHGPG